MHDQCAREADALAHAAGELARVGGFEAVQADQVDGRQARRRISAGGTRSASRPRATFS